MSINPSESADVTDFLLSLSNIQELQKLSDEKLEPPFDPLDAKLWKGVDLSKVPEISDLDLLSSEWRELIFSKLTQPKLSKFINFYISVTIEELQQSCKESVDEIDLLREVFEFYDALCEYEYLDKRVKKIMKGLASDVEKTRTLFYYEIYGRG
jgi:hypothetical protein